MKREARQEDRVRQIVREVLGKEAGSVIPMKEGMTNDSFLVKCVGGVEPCRSAEWQRGESAHIAGKRTNDVRAYRASWHSR